MTGPLFITPEEAPDWPHIPGPKVFDQAQAAHAAIYASPTPETHNPTPASQFALAELFDEFSNIHQFRQQAREEFEGLRLTTPDKPPRAHLIAVALTGHSPTTIGVAIATSYNTATFSLLLRDPDWTGLDPVLPDFRNRTAIIIVDRDSLQPQAAVGLTPDLLPSELPNHPEPNNQEARNLRTILQYHGATTFWYPF